MAILQYMAKVKDSLTLELPSEAQALKLRAGEEIKISVSENGTEETPVLPSNEKGLAAMRLIAERHKHQAVSDDANTNKHLRDARAGAMYGNDNPD